MSADGTAKTRSRLSKLPAPKLAFVQRPSAAERAEIEAAAKRGELIPFIDDLDAVAEELLRRGADVVATEMDARQPTLRGCAPHEIFAFGSLPTMLGWLQRFGLHDRRVPSYPPVFDKWLNRRFWRGTLSTLLVGPAARIEPVFAKTDFLCFIGDDRVVGRTWPSLSAMADSYPELADTAVFCSETVQFTSEYRCYVMDGNILGIYAYRLLGVACVPIDATALEQFDDTLRPTCELVLDMIRTWERSGHSPVSYALDLGRIAHGAMSLVEVNDAIAVRNYGLSTPDYLDFHLARWRQLTAD